MWRLALRFVLEGPITSPWRYGPTGATGPWQEGVLRCCTDVTLSPFFNELVPFLVCLPKKCCPFGNVRITHTNMRVKSNVELTQCLPLPRHFHAIKGVHVRRVFSSVFIMMQTLGCVLECWLGNKNVEMVLGKDRLISWVWGRGGGQRQVAGRPLWHGIPSSKVSQIHPGAASLPANTRLAYPPMWPWGREGPEGRIF